MAFSSRNRRETITRVGFAPGKENEGLKNEKRKLKKLATKSFEIAGPASRFLSGGSFPRKEGRVKGNRGGKLVGWRERVNRRTSFGRIGARERSFLSPPAGSSSIIASLGLVDVPGRDVSNVIPIRSSLVPRR